MKLKIIGISSMVFAILLLFSLKVFAFDCKILIPNA